MYNPYSLENKTILITGASSGIGKATAVECAKLGARVIITARREEQLKEVLDILEGNNHEYRVCDLRDCNSIIKLIDSINEINGLVNNAGFSKTLPVPYINMNSISDILQVNTIAPILLLSGLVKKRKLSKGSSVVFTCSVSGLGKTSPGNTMYASSKGAIAAFTMGAAKELAEKSIRVNSVCPGMVETNIIDKLSVSKEQLEADRQSFPLKRYGRPEEIAWAIIYLLSNASSWVTGTNLIIDGGRTLK